MTVSLELSGEKSFKDGGQASRPFLSRQTAYLSIVVTSRPRGGEGIIALGCPDSLNFISRDAHPDARAAHQYTAVEIALGNSLAYLPGDIRVIDGVTGIAAEILIGMAGLGYEFDDRILDNNPTVVTADCDFHLFNLLMSVYHSFGAFKPV